MGDKEESHSDLKGGHAPAVKVGGMRIVQHKKEGEKVEVPVPTEDEVAEFSSSPPKQPQMLVSGAVAKGDKDFSPQAVKSFHDKPTPTHDPKPRASQHSQQIHQPR